MSNSPKHGDGALLNCSKKTLVPLFGTLKDFNLQQVARRPLSLHPQKESKLRVQATQLGDAVIP